MEREARVLTGKNLALEDRNSIIRDLWLHAGWTFDELADTFGLEHSDVEIIVREGVKLHA